MSLPLASYKRKIRRGDRWASVSCWPMPWAHAMPSVMMNAPSDAANKETVDEPDQRAPSTAAAIAAHSGRALMRIRQGAREAHRAADEKSQPPQRTGIVTPNAQDLHDGRRFSMSSGVGRVKLRVETHATSTRRSRRRPSAVRWRQRAPRVACSLSDSIRTTYLSRGVPARSRTISPAPRAPTAYRLNAQQVHAVGQQRDQHDAEHRARRCPCRPPFGGRRRPRRGWRFVSYLPERGEAVVIRETARSSRCVIGLKWRRPSHRPA